MTDLPPIHFINLDRSAERLRRFHEVNGHIENVTRFAATDGAALDREALVGAGYISADLGYGAGTLGCALSHVRLWEMAVAQDRSLTIFEDDAVLSHQLQGRGAGLLSGLPADWDIVQWGCALNPIYAWVDFGSCRAKLHTYGARRYKGDAGERQFQEEDFPVTAVKLLHSFGFHAYSISAKGARAALEFCLPLRQRLIEFPDAGVRTLDRGIDSTLCGLYPDLKAYLCLPNLALDGRWQSVRQATDVPPEQPEL